MAFFLEKKPKLGANRHQSPGDIVRLDCNFEDAWSQSPQFLKPGEQKPNSNHSYALLLQNENENSLSHSTQP